MSKTSEMFLCAKCKSNKVRDIAAYKRISMETTFVCDDCGSREVTIKPRKEGE